MESAQTKNFYAYYLTKMFSNVIYIGMKKIVGYIKPYDLDKIIKSLGKAGIQELFFEEIKEYKNSPRLGNFLPRLKLQVIIEKKDLETMVSAISQNTSGFENSDDHIEIKKVEEIIDIQTGERNILNNL